MLTTHFIIYNWMNFTLKLLIIYSMFAIAISIFLNQIPWIIISADDSIII